MTEHPEFNHSVASAADRRKAIRYACILDATWEGKVSRFGDGWVARVLNISTGGLGLHLGECFQEGAVLTLGLHGLHNTLGPVKVRVVHQSEQEDSTWVLGAAFVTPLDEDDLQRLLS